ncbi:MAG: hypothetical protein A2017_18245 [Lentisphaerae bacterium GWF2_44_16]|nr:MAG: hypothetical protein A2017_18245 [Lentisphaerae bacterium GWF2_44_16]
MECFGKGKKIKKCGSCLYRKACAYASEESRKARTDDRRWTSQGRSFLELERDSLEMPVDIDNKELFTKDEVLSLASFLLRFAEHGKISKALSAKLQGAESIAEIARREGVSRQAVHKRIGEEMAKILGFKQRRLTDSALLSLTPREIQIIKLRREGKSYRQIAETVNCSKTWIIKSYRVIASKIGLKVTDEKSENKKSEKFLKI